MQAGPGKRFCFPMATNLHLDDWVIAGSDVLGGAINRIEYVDLYTIMDFVSW
jgi:hypothetical protein